MRRLPDQTIPAIRFALSKDGTFAVNDFIRNAGIGRVTLQRLVELGWAIELKSGRYKLTEVGWDAIGAVDR